MLRKLFLGACIGGLLMEQVFESPQEQQARTDELIVNLQSPDQKTRNIAEYKLLKVAKGKSRSKPQEAEVLIKQILGRNPNSADAHMRLAEMKLKKWSVNKNTSDKAAGMNHLRQAKRLYKQKNDELTVQKLEKVEQMVNRGSASYNWVFPM
ncbi:MAG: hypothetical protein AAGF26_05815 [Cyanobacteria bacterium P01_G01_bin.49]